jgi:hypothetical protein
VVYKVVCQKLCRLSGTERATGHRR